MPVPFAVAAGAQFDAANFLLGLCGFCLVNSAVYVLNDLFDSNADRYHPRKCRRPIASGDVRPGAAVVFGCLLMAAGIAITAATSSTWPLRVVLIYVVLNTLYSTGAKHIAVLDVFLIASGYVIRVYLGCALVDAVPSHWLLICSSSLALLLGFGRRRSDLNGETAVEHRPSLLGYNRAFLDHSMAISAGVALLAYAMYTVNSDVLQPGRELASLPFVAFAIFHYLRLVWVDARAESPVDVAYRSLTLQLCGLGWALSVFWSLK